MYLTTAILGSSVLFAVPAAFSPQTAAILAVQADEAVSGVVHSVDWDAKSFTLQKGESEEPKTVSWTDETTFMLDGQDSTAREVLVAKGQVRASLNKEGVATSVSRWSE